MFGRKAKEKNSFSAVINQKARLIHSKVSYALNREHEHFYSKNEVQNRNNNDPRCKVCGILLSEYRTTKKFEQWNSDIAFGGE